MANDGLVRRDLRWVWLAVAVAGAGIAIYWFARGAELYRSEGEQTGVLGAAATTARFAVLLAIGAALIDLVATLAAARTHTLSGATSLVCGIAGAAALVATAVHARASIGVFDIEVDAMLVPAIVAMAALTVGGLGLWFDARVEHRRAVAALAAIEHDIHAADHDLM